MEEKWVGEYRGHLMERRADVTLSPTLVTPAEWRGRAEAAEADLRRQREDNKVLTNQRDQWKNDCDTLAAERDRYREALEQVSAALERLGAFTGGDDRYDVRSALVIARSVLAPREAP